MKLIFHGFYTSSCKNDISAVQAVKLKITELGNTVSLNDTV
ncbi:hypothetical protein [Methanosarcina sp. WWM596]|nr:hypothetical protein [Methanosarcina sp. WWM596]